MRKKRPRARNSERHIPFKLTQWHNPIGHLSQEERSEIVQRMANEYSQEFEAKLSDLLSQLKRLNPLQVLAHFAYYDITTLDPKGDYGDSYKPLIIPHLEILQALFLSIPPNEMQAQHASPADLTKVNQLLRSICTAYNQRRISLKNGSASIPPAEQMRMYTQTVRSCVAPKKTLAMLRTLFLPLDDAVEAKTGIRPSLIVDTFLKLTTARAEELESRAKNFRGAMRFQTIQEVVNAYHAVLGESGSDKMIALCAQRGWNLAQTKSVLLQHYDEGLWRYYTFDLVEVVRAYPIPVQESAIRDLLDSWALTPTQVIGVNREHLFLSNPVWAQPLIPVRAGTYFWPILQSFLFFGLSMIERFIETQPEIHERYQQTIRPRYLEDETERVIRAHFPTAQTFRGSCWKDPDTNQIFENDILAILDSNLLVIECKSARIQPSARRGGDRLDYAIKNLLVEPSLQSARFVEHLLENRGKHELKTRKSGTNSFDTLETRKVLRLNVTLESLGPLACQFRLLMKSGVIKKQFEPAVTLSVSELDTALTLLEGVHQKLHYLIRRSEWEAHVDYVADEYDLLAFYLASGFNVGSIEFQKQKMMLFGAGEALTPYFEAQCGIGTAKKPRLRLTQWFRDILATMESRAFQGWTHAGLFLLAFDYEAQKHFESRVKALIKNVKSNWHAEGHENTLFCDVGPEEQKTAVAVYAYKNISRSKRDQTVNSIFAQLSDRSGCKDALIFGFMANRRCYPYDFVAVALGIGEGDSTASSA